MEILSLLNTRVLCEQAQDIDHTEAELSYGCHGKLQSWGNCVTYSARLVRRRSKGYHKEELLATQNQLGMQISRDKLYQKKR